MLMQSSLPLSARDSSYATGEKGHLWIPKNSRKKPCHQLLFLQYFLNDYGCGISFIINPTYWRLHIKGMTFDFCHFLPQGTIMIDIWSPVLCEKVMEWNHLSPTAGTFHCLRQLICWIFKNSFLFYRFVCWTLSCSEELNSLWMGKSVWYIIFLKLFLNYLVLQDCCFIFNILSEREKTQADKIQGFSEYSSFLPQFKKLVEWSL